MDELMRFIGGSGPPRSSSGRFRSVVLAVKVHIGSSSRLLVGLHQARLGDRFGVQFELPALVPTKRKMFRNVAAGQSYR